MKWCLNESKGEERERGRAYWVRSWRSRPGLPVTMTQLSLSDDPIRQLLLTL